MVSLLLLVMVLVFVFVFVFIFGNREVVFDGDVRGMEVFVLASLATTWIICYYQLHLSSTRSPGGESSKETYRFNKFSTM